MKEIWINTMEGCIIRPVRGLEPARPIMEPIPAQLPVPRTQWEKLAAVTTPKEIIQYIFAMNVKGAAR